MKFIEQAFSDRCGKASHVRIVSFLWVISIAFCLVWLTVKNHSFPAIPNEIIASVVGVLAVKAYQKGKEETTVSK